MGALAYKRDSEGFKIFFNSCEVEPLSWKEELFCAARGITNRTQKPLWLCSSGGIDSEIACRSFYDQGIHFSVLSLEYSGGKNAHDIRHAISWCAERGVEHKIVPLNIEEFFSKQIDSYTDRYRTIHPFRYLQIRIMEIVEEMGGFAVLGGGEQLYHADKTKKVLTKEDLHLDFSNGSTMPLEWCKDNELDHEPYFHFSTPELCLAFMRIPIIDFSLNHPEPIFRHYANTFALKRIAYQSVWSDLKIRNKQHGFEGVLQQYRESTWRLRDLFAKDYIQFNLPVVEFEKQLLGK